MDKDFQGFIQGFIRQRKLHTKEQWDIAVEHTRNVCQANCPHMIEFLDTAIEAAEKEVENENG